MCQKLGYGSGTISKKDVRSARAAVWVGKCNDGEGPGSPADLDNSCTGWRKSWKDCAAPGVMCSPCDPGGPGRTKPIAVKIKCTGERAADYVRADSCGGGSPNPRPTPKPK